MKQHGRIQRGDRVLGVRSGPALPLFCLMREGEGLNEEGKVDTVARIIFNTYLEPLLHF